MLTLIASTAFGQAWVPTPLVIDVQDEVKYDFDGTDIDIPFSQTGKPAMIWLIVNTMLDDAEKPVAVMNGFRGWHFVNGIDTTVYVSAGREYDPSATNTFPWNGHGNEREYEDYQDGDPIAPGTYAYYLLGFDNKNARELVSDFVACGDFMWPTMARFYPYDETGAMRARPMMGGGARAPADNSTRFDAFTWYKWTLGDDPLDESLFETTWLFGYQTGDLAEDVRQTYGPGFYDPKDYDTFYFTTHKYWENKVRPAKYTFVPGGEAVEDTEWNDWDSDAVWFFAGTKRTASEPSNLQFDDNWIYQNDCGHSPINFKCDLIRAFAWDDPEDVQFDIFLDEFFSANPIEDTVRERYSAEANRFETNYIQGQYFMTGDVTCLTELVDCNKMLEGGDQPWSSDGSGYVVWGNSNGDFFTDKMPYPNPEHPENVWACDTYEPRNANDPRKATSPADMNGFMLDFLEFHGLYSCAAYTQDGSGIDLLRFADDSFSAGGDNTQKKGNGSTLDIGSIYDGIYMLHPMQAEPSWGSREYSATNWIPWDSDGGIITSEDVAVESDAPAAFSVAQNSPNPFNPSTTINFSLAQDGQVTVDVFNIAGQKVDTLVNDFMTSGSHAVVWDASGQAAGVYFYTVASGDFTKTMKMTLLK
jgi:hypothetical protein